MDLDDISKEEFERIRKESQGRVAMQNTAPRLKRQYAAPPESPSQQPGVSQTSMPQQTDSSVVVESERSEHVSASRLVATAIALVILTFLIIGFGMILVAGNIKEGQGNWDLVFVNFVTLATLFFASLSALLAFAHVIGAGVLIGLKAFYNK